MRVRQGWKPPPLPEITPGLTADIGDLVSFWENDRRRQGLQPTHAIRDRILKHCEETPRLFSRLAHVFLPKDAGVADRIKALHEKLNGDSPEQRESRLAARDWLMMKAGYLRKDLLALAESSFAHPNTTKFIEYLDAYLLLEPVAGETLLLKHARDSSPPSRCLSLLRLHARAAEMWRPELQALVKSNVEADLRRQALEALVKKPWPGWQDWVLELFCEAQLGDVSAKNGHHEPLAVIVREAPDYWVSRLVPLVGHPDRNIHNNAVRCLAQFHLKKARLDALRPLLPWLNDPDWALDEEHYGRLRLIQSLDCVELRECVPDLLKALELPECIHLTWIADALAHYKVTKAVPQLRHALMKLADHNDRRKLAESIMKLEGFTDAEAAKAIEVHERQTMTPEGREVIDDVDSFKPSEETRAINPEFLTSLAIGEVFLGSRGRHTETLAKAVLTLATSLNSAETKLAERLKVVVASWDTPTSTTLIKERLRTGKLTEDWTAMMLDECPVDKETLATIRDLPLVSEALLAVLNKNQNHAEKLLLSHDAGAQAMLLACARLKRMQLPLKLVRGLLDSPHILCRRAAELYLEALDSQEARQTLWDFFPGEARILGARMDFDPGHFSFGELGEIETRLRKRVLAKEGPEEIFGLLSAGYWGDNGQLWVERRKEGPFLVNDQGGGRQRTRKLTEDEFDKLRNYVTEYDTDSLPPLNLPVHDGIQYEYVHLTREEGVRVFMNNPGSMTESLDKEINDAVYVSLVALFRELITDESLLVVEYLMADEIPGLKILVPEEKWHVEAVWGHQGKLYMKAAPPGDRVAQWMTIEGQEVKTIPGVELPMLIDPNDGSHSDFEMMGHLINAPWRASLKEAWVLPMKRKSDGVSGLWCWKQAAPAAMIARGTFANPLTSPDGEWIVAARRIGSTWAEPNDMVRVHVETGEIFPLKLPPADEFKTLTRLPASGQFLLMRSQDNPAPGIEPEEGAAKPNHYLLDITTGETQMVNGEFGPLHDESWRPLQPTGKPDEVWAAVLLDPRNPEAGAKIGHYNLRQFKFESILEIPGIWLNSMSFWVDTASSRVLLVVNGDLLSLDLPES